MIETNENKPAALNLTAITAARENNNVPKLDADTNETIDLNIVYWQRTIAERIKLKIDEHAKAGAGDGFRSHLGWSVIGHDCLRYLYYHWRWFWKEEHHARMERIFIEGHKIEAELRHILKACGAVFLDTVDENGEQIRVSNLGGHFGGSVDGVFVWPAIGLHEPTLLECKSSKTGSPFNSLVKHGVMKEKPRHFGQQSGYGKGLDIKFACYVTRNKNDSDLFVEIVDLDFTLAEELAKKAQFVILTNQVPKRISEKANFRVCNMCAIKPLCHERKAPTPNCRNCKYSLPVEDGQWKCTGYDSIIPKEFIIQGCPQHEFLPW